MRSYKSLAVVFLVSIFLGAGCASSPSGASTYTPPTSNHYFYSDDEYEEEPETVPEPENPYSPGSGHYAGFEWGERTGRTCGGNSASFIEGCEEYQRQQEEYDNQETYDEETY